MSKQKIHRIELDLARQKSLRMHADTRKEMNEANNWIDQLEGELARALDEHDDDAER